MEVIRLEANLNILVLATLVQFSSPTPMSDKCVHPEINVRTVWPLWIIPTVTPNLLADPQFSLFHPKSYRFDERERIFSKGR